MGSVGSYCSGLLSTCPRYASHSLSKTRFSLSPLPPLCCSHRHHPPSPLSSPLVACANLDQPVGGGLTPPSQSSSSSSSSSISSSSPLQVVEPASDAGASGLVRRKWRESERTSYLLAAMASSTGIMAMSVGAVYYRFAWQLESGDVPLTEMFGTFSLAIGAAVGMEYWARWAHKALWHDSLWLMHESHHRPREGQFELNDIFAIINAVPAIALIAYGFFHKGLVPGLCFGAGLGITIFGMAYMFVHDGLIHRRFPVGPIADVPYLQRVAAAHQLHHADKFVGVPYGLFLGPQELEEVGGLEELEKVMEMRKKEKVPIKVPLE